jgi:hypothetical protein
MAITAKKFQKNSIPARVYLDGTPTTISTSQTSKNGFKFTPGVAFQIEEVQVYCLTTVATLTFNVLIGTTTVLTAQITPVADTVVLGSLLSSVVSLRGKATDQISVQYTSGASGAAVDLSVTVAWRQYPCDGEA